MLHNHWFQFLLGQVYYPKEIGNNGYAKFWGVNKMPYGLGEYGELILFKIDYLPPQIPSFLFLTNVYVMLCSKWMYVIKIIYFQILALSR